MRVVTMVCCSKQRPTQKPDHRLEGERNGGMTCSSRPIKLVFLYEALLLTSSSIQGRDENHSSLSRSSTPGDQTLPIKLLQKLLGYNSTLRANEENSRSQNGS
ncbi:hypothetical protein AVEN_14315-1 [Araneus ventricosus]|uniref:Uncharacterized protein n=1 Tax=Araneus ventricosus TaxID=182803 RepID=A0A4Y2UNY1_ARAVE|nr:hypothetical protein AVEN_14315-1 [Araneus ventricosus]